jgi:ubiquinone/menaquinone biosynthesis C-methylase UbiE
MYDEHHPEINVEEITRLKRFLTSILPVYKSNKLHIVDIGCGTGYLTQIVLEICQSSNRISPYLLCLEPSKDMLSICKRRLKDYSNVIFIAGNIDELISRTLYNQHFDIVLTSSLLHHIPNIYMFGKKVPRLLSPNGHWLMLHEPSAAFYTNHFLLSAENRYKQVFRLRAHILRKIKQWDRDSTAESQTRNSPHILDLTSQVLKERGITPSTSLDRREVRGLIDIHTLNPHLGGFNIGYNGFDKHQLQTAYSQFGMDLVHYESYMHLGLIKKKGSMTRALEYAFQKLWPNDGLLFSAIWQNSLST